jgi:predicted GIY-YIG superfamily endonuclease
MAKAGSGYYYVGISPNPKKRVEKHNAGMGSQMARQHGSFGLLYVSEPFNKSEARKREVQLKGWSRKKKEKLIQGEWN